MRLATQYFYVNNGIQFQGIFCTITVREFDQFLIKCELYKFKTTDPVILNTIEQECENNSTRIEILNKIDSDLVSECSLTYPDIEIYHKQLYTDIISMKSNNPDEFIRYNLSIYDRMNITLNIVQARRFYNNLRTFYTDYILLENMFKMIVLSGTAKPAEEKDKINNYAKGSPKEVQQSEQKSPIPPPPPKNINTKAPSILDSLMKFGVNNVIGSSLTHFIFNYFRYVSKDVCFVENEENGIIIVCPPILPSNYMFDTPYFKSLINSIANVDIEYFSFYMSKLINGVTTNNKIKETPLYIMIITYLNLIYSLRYMYDSHTNWLYENIDNVIADPVRQTKILNHHINQYVKSDVPIRYDIREVNIFEYEPDQYIEDIKNISNEYSHLIPVDQMKFADIVLDKMKQTESKLPEEFKMGRKKIFDLDSLKKNSIRESKNKRREPLFATDKLTPNISNEVLESNLLHYEFDSEDQLLTKAYRTLMKYIQDPGIIMLIKDDVIPKVVRNLFETLKNILTPQIFNKDEMNTLQLYKILCDNLPDAKVLSHTTLMYIVFQIIIPYYADVNKVKTFNDQLLI